MRQDWRVAEAYLLDPTCFASCAWEFLRGNGAYRVAYQSITSTEDADLVARRWGRAANPDLCAADIQNQWLPISACRWWRTPHAPLPFLREALFLWIDAFRNWRKVLKHTR
jgi:hypothetical protein